MDKVAFAKMLGLEADVVPYEEVFEESEKLYQLPTDAHFRIGDKYFTIEANSVKLAWEAAADKLISDLMKQATVYYNTSSYYSR